MAFSLFTVFISGLLGGFAATLMPCIFPMLPLTVSYFTKTSVSRAAGIQRALLYGLSIILIYVSLGLLVTVVFGADALNRLSTNGIFNFIFFAVLLAFAFSLLGGFDITLPSKWINKIDRRAEQRGFAGLFFMAGTLALVSFSCTGPIIGTLLVQAAANGKLLAPAIGMFGFSFALALPFSVFALAPNMLTALPRSGKWLVDFKTVLGFLELALSLKFLSNIDLAYHFNLLNRAVFLVLWITIAILLGCYVLGKLRFADDSVGKVITVPRLVTAIIVFSFALYMVPGLWGAPLKPLAGFLPPQQTQDFDLYTMQARSTALPSVETKPRKYANLFQPPAGLDVYFDYEEGMAAAKEAHMPVMVDFTGHSCVNCRKMEATVWTDKSVFAHLSHDYILIQLYVDDKTDLPQAEQYTSAFSHRLIRRLGQKWCDLQASKFNSNSQPFYVLLDDNGKMLEAPSGADYDPVSFNRFLENGLKNFSR